MQPQNRSAEIDRLFAEALELTGEGRTSFVAGLRARDAELATAVEGLLAAADEPDSRLDRARLLGGAVLDGLAGGGRPERIGQRVGAYRIVRKLGHGGMATVYLAERADDAYRQQVAVKFLESWAGGEQARLRFEQEQQILATLDHPAIARLLDAGYDAGGQPYLVMEYVPGRPVDRHCADGNLDLEHRVQLVEAIARAVQVAHTALVVHRDLKPSNILVTDAGEIRLVDFGIAKLLEPGMAGLAELPATRTGLRPMTPEYASPEQVRGERITAASDVYQLGLIAYELFTGERLVRFETSTPAEVERTICHDEPSPPSVRVATAPADRTVTRPLPGGLDRSALAGRLRGDLDTIVLRALQKAPEHRYGSAGELADDLQRYLTGQPIRARRPTLGYRTAKFVRRHRTALAWGTVAAVLAGWLLGTLVAQSLRVASEARRAHQVERLVGELFALPNPRMEPQPPTARDYVDHAVQLVTDELADQPASQNRLLTLLGRSYNALGFYGPSIDVLQRSLDLAESRSGRDSPQVAEILGLLARSQYYDGRYEPAERSLRRARGLLEQRFGSADPAVIGADLELGDLLHTRGRLREAEALLRSALARLGDTDDQARAAGLRDLGNVLRDRGAQAEAEACYRRSLELYDSLSLGSRQQVATAEVYYARLLIMQGDLAGAERLLVDDLAVLRRIYGGDHPLTGTVLRNLGYLRLEQGRFDQAAATLAEAQTVLGHWLGPDHPMLARNLACQAELERRRGRLPQAVDLARTTLDRFEALGLADHPVALDACTTLGLALLELERPSEAATALRPCRDAARRQYVSGDPRTAAISRALERATSASAVAAGPAPVGRRQRGRP